MCDRAAERHHSINNETASIFHHQIRNFLFHIEKKIQNHLFTCLKGAFIVLIFLTAPGSSELINL
jgi:dTDP-4-dehydrorhamnose 3,5-epimerase-like enzyme